MLTKSQIEIAIGNIVSITGDYCIEHDRRYLVTGVSGGMDSGVVIALNERVCQYTSWFNFDLTSIGVTMPCHSTPESLELAREVIKKFGAEEIHIDLSDSFDFIQEDVMRSTDFQIFQILKEKKDKKRLKAWKDSKKVAQGNIKARLRMALGTYHTARMMGGMVMSTDNLSELLMSFWTTHGDVGDWGMIQNVFKGSELYQIGEYLGVPKGILKAVPDDGLGVADGGDAAQLGGDYPTVDKVMITLIQNGFDPDGSKDQLESLMPVPGVDHATVLKIASRSVNNSFKRKGPINLTREQLGLPPIEDIEV